MKKSNPDQLPIQPVESPVICSPYTEPSAYWHYDKETGEATKMPTRRPAGYYYKTEAVGTGQRMLGFLEDFDELTLVNRLREDVKRWRESGYRGASNVTRELLNHWTQGRLERPLFICQREAVETVIYLAELRLTQRSSRTGFKHFEVTDEDIRLMLAGERPTFQQTGEYWPTLVDIPPNSSLLPLPRLACKMATGSGKTVVMAMLIAWAFCNRGQNPQSTEFPNAVLVCCPNLTVKERLQVLRPDRAGNYFEAFNLVPSHYRPLMQKGLVLIENWHQMAEESEHKEGDSTYAVVRGGLGPWYHHPCRNPQLLGREIANLARMPITVMKDRSSKITA